MKMTKTQYENILKSHVTKKDFIKLKRIVKKGEANVSGFILQMSKDFLLIQKEEEFYLNGYAIIRRDHFDSIRCNKFDKTFKKILISEGIFDRDYGIKNKVSLSSWEKIFKDLKKFGYHIIVECEDLEDPLFVIGPIKKINRNSVSIQYFDPTGLLDKKTTTVKYKDITIVKFDDRYTNVFRKYLRKN